MSASLDLVRSISAAWERGDFSSAEWAHPELEFVAVGGLHPGRSRGVAGMAETWRIFLGAWEDFRAEAEEYRELDKERVLVLQRSSARGKTSGREVGQISMKSANLFHARDGKVTKLVLYGDRDRALVDLGLAPEGGSEP
jgi:ketosteroid isomerase-like protein